MHEPPDFDPDARPQSLLALTVPVWAVWALFVSALTAGGVFLSFTVYFVNTLNTINTKLDRAGDDRWRLSFQRQYGNELWQLNNGAIKVPNADDIAHRLNQ